MRGDSREGEVAKETKEIQRGVGDEKMGERREKEMGRTRVVIK